jgi:hypothetical protein
MNLKIEIVKTHRQQQDIARRIKMPPGRLSGIISGFLNPKPAEERALRRVLGSDDPALFVDDDNSEGDVA